MLALAAAPRTRCRVAPEHSCAECCGGIAAGRGVRSRIDVVPALSRAPSVSAIALIAAPQPLFSAGARRLVNNRHRWLWVPAFAGTTYVGLVAIGDLSKPPMKPRSSAPPCERPADNAWCKGISGFVLDLFIQFGNELAWARFSHGEPRSRHCRRGGNHGV